MNSLKIPQNGGMPFVQDDLKWMQDGIAAAIAGLGKVYGVNNYFIDGINISTSPITNVLVVNGGNLLLNGEVRYLAPTTTGFDATGATLYIVPNDRWDSAGLKTFQDSSSHQCYRVGECLLIGATTVPTGGVALTDFISREALLATSIQGQPQTLYNRIGFYKTNCTITTGNLNLDKMFNVYDLTLSSDDILSDLDPAGHASRAGTYVIVNILGSSYHELTVIASGTIRTPASRNYIYRTGETMLFICDDGGVWHLIDRAADSDSGYIGVFPINGWSATTGTPAPKVRMRGRQLWIYGSVICPSSGSGDQVVFQIATDYRPLTDQVQRIVSLAGTRGTITLTTGGDCRITLSAAGDNYLLTGFVFTLD